MPLPLITENMMFHKVLLAIEQTLVNEAANQVALGGIGWRTVRERFDPWNVEVDEFNPGVVNVMWSNSNFPESEGTSFNQVVIASYDIDCYASEVAIDNAGTIIPKDQRAADVLHALITRVYYTLMSPINYDLGLDPGTISRPWVSSINKFAPVEANIPVDGVIAARLTYNIRFEELPPEGIGENLETINVITDTDAGGLVDQSLDVT